MPHRIGGWTSGAAYTRPSRRDIRSTRAIAYTSALLAVVIGIVHAALAPVIIVAGVKPNLILVAVVLVAATFGLNHGSYSSSRWSTGSRGIVRI